MAQTDPVNERPPVQEDGQSKERDANYDPRLTKAAQRLVVLTDGLSSAYEDLETLALKVSFSAEQK